eukprot:GFYU01000076.1.p1 GENE.GFYU01000076.1~~GFYU01000076.1.p1  ORF type:complete len:104 (+),score=10.89 GFYU01000076.1:87-398(+)
MSVIDQHIAAGRDHHSSRCEYARSERDNIKCAKCFEPFDELSELRQHLKADPGCKVEAQELKRRIDALKSIPEAELTDTQRRKLILLRIRQACLRRLSRRDRQ